MSFKLLVDENLPVPTTDLLRSAGHDVASVLEISPGVSDAEVLAYAVAERRILVTLDKQDFGELIYYHGLPAPPGMILFRLPDIPAEELSNRVARTIAAQDDWRGSFWVIEEKGIRSRPFPDS